MRLYALWTLFLSPSLGFASAIDWNQQLAPYVRVLKRPIVVFHYGQRSHAQAGGCPATGCEEIIDLSRDGNYDSSVELRPPEVVDYFTSMSSMYAQGLRSDWSVGGGLYAGVDPVQSFGYAKKPWFLLQITIPAGTAYLDLRLKNDFVMGDGKSQTVMQLFKDPLYRAEFVAALKAHHVGILAYAWELSAYLACQQFQGRNGEGAFDFIDPDLSTQLDFKTFVNSIDSLTPSVADLQKRDAYQGLYEIFGAVNWRIHMGEVIEDPAERLVEFHAEDFEHNTFLVEWGRSLSSAGAGPRTLGPIEKFVILKKVQNQFFGCSSDNDYAFERVW